MRLHLRIGLINGEHFLTFYEQHETAEIRLISVIPGLIQRIQSEPICPPSADLLIPENNSLKAIRLHPRYRTPVCPISTRFSEQTTFEAECLFPCWPPLTALGRFTLL